MSVTEAHAGTLLNTDGVSKAAESGKIVDPSMLSAHAGSTVSSSGAAGRSDKDQIPIDGNTIPHTSIDQDKDATCSVAWGSVTANQDASQLRAAPSGSTNNEPGAVFRVLSADDSLVYTSMSEHVGRTTGSVKYLAAEEEEGARQFYVCEDYLGTGRCAAGANCPKIHIDTAHTVPRAIHYRDKVTAAAVPEVMYSGFNVPVIQYKNGPTRYVSSEHLYETKRVKHFLEQWSVTGRVPPYKLVACRGLEVSGRCLYGKNCNFVHAVKSDRQNPAYPVAPHHVAQRGTNNGQQGPHHGQQQQQQQQYHHGQQQQQQQQQQMMVPQVHTTMHGNTPQHNTFQGVVEQQHPMVQQLMPVTMPLQVPSHGFTPMGLTLVSNVGAPVATSGLISVSAGNSSGSSITNQGMSSSCGTPYVGQQPMQFQPIQVSQQQVSQFQQQQPQPMWYMLPPGVQKR